MELPENIRAFLEQPRMCVMATINADGSPQLTVMWYELVADTIILNMAAGLVKERNLRRDLRIAVCVEDGPRYVTLTGRAEIIEDRATQEKEVNRMATRYVGLRLGANHWVKIMSEERLGVHMPIERFYTWGFT